MSKCACQMTSLEILEDHIRVMKPNKSILIVDSGSGWTVTMFGPDNAGVPSEHITLQSALSEVEINMTNLRRQSDEQLSGTIITDPQEILDALAKDKRPPVDRDMSH